MAVNRYAGRIKFPTSTKDRPCSGQFNPRRFLPVRGSEKQEHTTTSPFAYPRGLDRSTFSFIVPSESDRRKWKELEGINLWDEQIYRIAMNPDGRRNTFVPESL
jgi:hypothetical protein